MSYFASYDGEKYFLLAQTLMKQDCPVEISFLAQVLIVRLEQSCRFGNRACKACLDRFAHNAGSVSCDCSFCIDNNSRK